MHFYFGNMTAMRKHLAPGLMDAYEDWHMTGRQEKLEKLLLQSQAHWQDVAKEAIELFTKSLDAEPVENLIKSRMLS